MKSSRIVASGEVTEIPSLELPLATADALVSLSDQRDDAFTRQDGWEKVGSFRTDPFELPPKALDLVATSGVLSGLEVLLDHFAIEGLKADPAFKSLPQEVQDKMLAAAAASPRPLAKTFQDLANNANFRALAPSTQAIAVEQLGKHPRDTAATNTIYRLLNTRGFEQLNTDEKNRLLHLVGGNNNFISVPERQALATLTSSAAYTTADVTRKGQMLRDFLEKQAATPYLAAQNAGALPRAPYTVSEGKDTGEYGFRSGKAEGVTYDVKIGDQTIKVTLPKNPPAGSNLPSIDEIAKSLAALPPGSRAVVKEVVVNPGQNPDDAYWEKVYGTPGFRSYMTAGKEGVVNIYPTSSAQSQTVLENSMVHETGHALSKLKWGDDLNDPRWQPWKDAVAKDGIVPSRYGKNSLNEDFAETLVIYMNVKGTPAEAEMRALMPERFKLIDELLK
jgi:hypothetical protein